MENPKFPCSRHGFSTLSNDASVNSKAWWKRLFEIMVKEVCVPPHLCVEVLKDIFPNKILDCIYTILGIKKKPLKSVVSDETIQELVSHFLKPDYVAQCNKNRLVEKLNDLNMSETKEITKFSDVLQIRDMKIKAYQKYLHKKEKIIIFDKNLKLSIKAKMITEKIARDFVKWLKKFEKNVQSDIIEIFKLFNITFAFAKIEEDSDSCSSYSSPRVSSTNTQRVKKPQRKIKQTTMESNTRDDIFEFDQILKMFEIGVQNEATTSTVVEVAEIPFGGLKNVFQLAEEEAALRKRKKEKERMHYYYTLIQERPVHFCKSKFIKELESMEVTFKHITHLRSVKAYCKWLIDHPEKVRPKFLEKVNMFDPALLVKSEESINVIDTKNIF